jgi:hypothetical protein
MPQKSKRVYYVLYRLRMDEDVDKNLHSNSMILPSDNIFIVSEKIVPSAGHPGCSVEVLVRYTRWNK